VASAPNFNPLETLLLIDLLATIPDVVHDQTSSLLGEERVTLGPSRSTTFSDARLAGECRVVGRDAVERALRPRLIMALLAQRELETTPVDPESTPAPLEDNVRAQVGGCAGLVGWADPRTLALAQGVDAAITQRRQARRAALARKVATLRAGGSVRLDNGFWLDQPRLDCSPSFVEAMARADFVDSQSHPACALRGAVRRAIPGYGPEPSNLRGVTLLDADGQSFSLGSPHSVSTPMQPADPIVLHAGERGDVAALVRSPTADQRPRLPVLLIAESSGPVALPDGDWLQVRPYGPEIRVVRPAPGEAQHRPPEDRAPDPRGRV